jgi:large subunit ribosomal protein L24e
MVKCSFCGREEESFRGVHLIRNIGVVSFYCSSKCRKNDTKLGRDKRKWKWTEAFHQTREKARDKEKAVIEAAKNPKEEKKKSATRKIGVKKAGK